MNKFEVKDLSRQAIVAALYVAITLSISPIASGPIQFRISEVMNLLAFYNPMNAIGVVIGVFISNMFSPLGAADLIFGTLHSAISLYFISKSKNLWIASIWPAVFAFIIGYELSVIAGFGTIAIMTAQVMLSEIIIMTIIGVPLFKLLEKNKNFLDSIESIR